MFAPAAYNLAETSRMVEIAKGVRDHDVARSVFDIHFISEGGDFEKLITDNGFSLTTVGVPLSPEKISHIAAVNDEEKFAPIYTKRELIEKVQADVACLRQLKPAAVITGSYVSMPVSCQVLRIPLVWTVQSTWFQSFFASGAGLTDLVRPSFLKKIADFFFFQTIKFWMWYCFIHGINRAAGHFGVRKYKPIFSYFEGTVTLVAEAPEFTGATLPAGHHFIGPLMSKQSYPLPDEIRDIAKDLPLVYFAMGSSGTYEVVSEILRSFAGQPYRVIAPVKFILDRGPPITVPHNVIVTDWLPAMEVNEMADVSVIHGGIGTVMTAAYAGKPIVGIGMQPEQVANIASLVRKGVAIRVPRSKKLGTQVQQAIRQVLVNDEMKKAAARYAQMLRKWNGPRKAAEILLDSFGQTGKDSGR